MKDAGRARRSVPLRWSLFLAFALLVALIAGAILTVSLVQTGRMTDDMAAPLIEEAQHRMATELRRLFDPITEQAASAYGWLQAGLVRRYEPDALMALFFPGMSQLPQCVSMMVSDMTGYEFTLFRNGFEETPLNRGEGPQWLTRDFRRENRPATWPKQARWTRWDANGKTGLESWWENPTWTVQDVLNHRPSGTSPEAVLPEDLVYDPTKRIWHQGPRARYHSRTMTEVARNPEEAIYWTDIDYFFTSRAPGMTAGIAAKDPRGDMVVIAYDLLLGDLSAFTRALHPTRQGKVFVFTPSGRLVGLPHDERFDQASLREETLLKPVEASGLPELSACMQRWKGLPEGGTVPFRFQSEGRAWWGGVRPFRISSEQRLWLGVVIPESDLIGAAGRERLSIVLIALAALGLSMVLAWYLSRAFAGPLRTLTDQSRRIADLDLESEPRPSSRIAEIRQLAESLEAMRASLARDITERERSEEALQQSEERYRSLVENTLDGYFICELPSGAFIFLNQSICDLAGYTLEEGLGLTIWDVVHPEEQALIRARIQARMEGREPPFTSHTYRALRKDGTEFRAEVSTSLVTYQGKPVMQGVLRDVTEQEKLQLQLQQAQKMEAIGTLAGGIAHDFNNLLMGIQGRTSLLTADVDPSHPQVEHLQGIEEYIRSATDLTKQLLGFARGGKYEVKSTDLNELIQKGSRFFSRTRKEIHVHWKLQPDLWSVEVDRRQIEQVLLNLYINAWQAMPAGGDLVLQTENVALGAEDVALHDLPPGRYVKVSVTDTGMGMDESTRHKAFDPFFTTKERGRGTGLGLASAYGIVQNHQGLIQVDSEVGEGTTFRLYLPASGRDVVQEEAVEPELLRGSGTVLLVDDEPMVVDVGGPMLEKLGYRVLNALGGRAAVELVREHRGRIDLVILDMVMPDLNGGETFDLLKEMEPGIKVLLSSGYSLDGQARDILQRGCDGFIQKPFDLYELSRKLHEILRPA